MAEELNWGAEAVDPSERSLPGLKAAFLVEHTPRRGRVLEIGSGDGKMLRTIHARHPDVELVGCDVRPPRTSPDCYSFRPIEGALPRDWSGTFDAVLIMDVLEHVPDPDALLRDAAACLRPNGKLVSFVPVEGELLSAYTVFRAVLGKNVYVDTKEHIQSFRHRDLAQRISRYFDIQETKYAYHLLGQWMDAGFFAAQRLGSIRDLWRRDNSFYNADKKDEGGKAGAMNRLLRLGNALAWAESRVLADVRIASAGVLLSAVVKDRRGAS